MIFHHFAGHRRNFFAIQSAQREQELVQGRANSGCVFRDGIHDVRLFGSLRPNRTVQAREHVQFHHGNWIDHPRSVGVHKVGK